MWEVYCKYNDLPLGTAVRGLYITRWWKHLVNTVYGLRMQANQKGLCGPK